MLENVYEKEIVLGINDEVKVIYYDENYNLLEEYYESSYPEIIREEIEAYFNEIGGYEKVANDLEENGRAINEDEWADYIEVVTSHFSGNASYKSIYDDKKFFDKDNAIKYAYIGRYLSQSERGYSEAICKHLYDRIDIWVDCDYDDDI